MCAMLELVMRECPCMVDRHMRGGIHRANGVLGFGARALETGEKKHDCGYESSPNLRCD